MMISFPLYNIPPLLCLITGVSLALGGLYRREFKFENLLFPLICIWWSMPSSIFISHYVLSDPGKILILEKGVHLLFVFIVPINVFFFHQVLGLKRRYLEAAMFIASGAFALLIPADNYLSGLHCYEWGCIAKAGTGIMFFGVYCLGALAYTGALIVKSIRKKNGERVKMKTRYLLLPIIVMEFLRLLDFPAMMGIDLYPPGNFVFIPLAIMWIGTVRYGLIDVRGVLHRTLIWAVLVSVIIMPNVLLYALLNQRLAGAGGTTLFPVFALWFILNYLFFTRVRPLINKIFRRRMVDLARLESQFIGDIAFLKNVKNLIEEFQELFSHALKISGVEVYLKQEGTVFYENTHGAVIEVDQEIEEWFIGADHMAERSSVTTSPYYGVIREKLVKIFDGTGCGTIIPLVQTHTVLGLVMVPRRKGSAVFSEEEVRFINGIRTAVSISLSNSLMYQNLSAMKENLEVLVEERTRELQKKNDQMTFELKVASDVQKLILSPRLPDTDRLRVAAGIIPLMEVSGDFYSVTALGPDTTAFAIVDVSGHGLPSALLTSMIKAELEGQLKIKNRRASEVCAAINRNLSPHLQDTGFYFTMILGIINIEKMTFEYTNCGHPAPLIVSTGGNIREMGLQQLPVGLTADAVYEDHVERLHEGDRIVAFSDGIVDARNSRDEFYGDRCLMDEIRTTLSKTPRSQVTAILNSIAVFQEKPDAVKKDDMTILIAEIKKPSAGVESVNPKDALEYFRAKQYDMALTVLEGADESELNPLYRFLAGKLHFRMGDFQRSLDCLDKALEGDGDNIEYLYFKGKVLYKARRLEESAALFRRVLDINPGYKQAARLVEKIGRGSACRGKA